MLRNTERLGMGEGMLRNAEMLHWKEKSWSTPRFGRVLCEYR